MGDMGPEVILPINPKSEIEKAFNRIIGYCDKHTDCSEGCVFYVEDGKRDVCFFANTGCEAPPCDWEKK